MTTIPDAETFVRLRTSQDMAEYTVAAHGEASVAVWLDVIARFPDMREWVAINKTVPLDILRVLAVDRDPRVRFTVAMKRKLDRPLFELLSRDEDDSVRRRIASNSKTPADIRARLKDELPPIVIPGDADQA